MSDTLDPCVIDASCRMSRMEGIPSPSELTTRLQTIIDSNEINLIQARQDRAERSATQSLRLLQDIAYEESLRADQAKDRRREEERLAREAEEAREREELNAQEMEIQRIRMEKELTVEKVPLEPETNNPYVCHLQIKLGERTVKRRFLLSDNIEVIARALVFPPFNLIIKWAAYRYLLFDNLSWQSEKPVQLKQTS
jgi:FAS-associated factor 2